MRVNHTLGVEEEFHVVDPVSRRLVNRATDVLGALPADSPRFKPELQGSVVEGNSDVAQDLDSLRSDLHRLRAEMSAAADQVGLAVVAAGTVPLADPDDISVSDDPRYRQMSEDYQQLCREQLICGVQTHVGLPDEDLALAVAHRVTAWLPVLLAITASSPFWLGRDTGYASWRTQVWRRWPTTGPLPPLDSQAHLDELSTQLVDTGVVSDAGMLYWDIRLNQRFCTLEFRVGDAAPSVETVVAIAGLARGLVATAEEELGSRDAPAPAPLAIVEAGRWRASRSGLTGDLVHPLTGRPRPAAEVLAALVDHVRPALEAEGDLHVVRRALDAALAQGGSAAQQRAAAAAHGFGAAVDGLIAQTAGRDD